MYGKGLIQHTCTLKQLEKAFGYEQAAVQRKFLCHFGRGMFDRYSY